MILGNGAGWRKVEPPDKPSQAHLVSMITLWAATGRDGHTEKNIEN